MKSLLLVCSLLLVGCGSVKQPTMGELVLSQPAILPLDKGTLVKTRDGVYTAQDNEVWHSDQRFRELERKGY